MVISKKAFEFISANVDDLPPETGGILGSTDGVVVSEVIMDKSDGQRYNCYYAPNVRFLNGCIASWQENGVSFMGVFHSHYAGVKTLSVADEKYIGAIMNAMPKEISSLLFPVFVLPQRELVCYRATRELSAVSIESEKVEIID